MSLILPKIFSERTTREIATASLEAYAIAGRPLKDYLEALDHYGAASQAHRSQNRKS
jgi:hypothetical protein